MINLEQVDQVIERTGVSYKEAKEALEYSDGDVVDAIIYIEENTKSFKEKMTDDIKVKKDDLVATLKELLRKGNVTKIIIEKDGEVKMNIPVNIGIAAGALSVFMGAVLIPVIGVISVGMYIGDYKIRIVKDDGSEVDVNEETKKRVYLLKGYVDEKAGDLEENWEIIKDKAQEFGEEAKKKAKEAMNDTEKAAKDIKKEVKDAAKDAEQETINYAKDLGYDAEKIKNETKEELAKTAKDINYKIKDAAEKIEEKGTQVQKKAEDAIDNLRGDL